MATRVAIIGLDPLQRDWLEALAEMGRAGEVEIVAVGHRTLAAAKDLAAALQAGAAAPAAYDDARLLLNDASPEVLVLDRSSRFPLEQLLHCTTQKIGVLALGPPVENVGEAQALAERLEAKSHLLYVWPRTMDSAGFRQATDANLTEEWIRPIKFAWGSWLGANHALAKGGGGLASSVGSVRSLSVLAWDALSTLIAIMGLPSSVYASVRGTVGTGASFSDLSGSASLTMRFAEDVTASLVLSDQWATAPRRELALAGQGGTAVLTPASQVWRSAAGAVVDESAGVAPRSPREEAASTFREFLRHRALPTSPQRGWEHRIEATAAALEAMVVSHRTGQPESPERFLRLRR